MAECREVWSASYLSAADRRYVMHPRLLLAAVHLGKGRFRPGYEQLDSFPREDFSSVTPVSA
jgi:hypothetical protein